MHLQIVKLGNITKNHKNIVSATWTLLSFFHVDVEFYRRWSPLVLSLSAIRSILIEVIGMLRSEKNKIIYLQMVKLENIAKNDVNVLLCHMDAPFFHVDIEFYMVGGHHLYRHLRQEDQY